MKINEIIFEDTSAEEQLGGEDSLTTNLLPVLMFLKKRSEDKELSPKLHTNSLIQLVQNAGDTTFNYETLVNAYENNESVKELISDFNEEEITLTSDSEEAEKGRRESEPKDKDPQKTVAQMAKKARANRSE